MRSDRRSARIRIRKARADEFERLREIAIAAKGHWGYEPALVQEWAAGGEFEPESLSKRLVYAAIDEAEGEPVGWASLIPRGEVGWLEDLWIEPGWIGHGLGRLLFEHIGSRALELGAKRLEWEAEPNARGFYERMGAAYVRDSDETEWGRVLEVLGLTLRAGTSERTRPNSNASGVIAESKRLGPNRPGSVSHP